MVSFLKSFFHKTEPDILDSLKDLMAIDDVTDVCFFDAEGNVAAMVSKYGNEESVFSGLGKEVVRTALLLDTFSKEYGTETKACHLKYNSGSILLWNFRGSFLMVLLRDTGQLPIVRMTVNIFKQNASSSEFFGKYFQDPDRSIINMWDNDRELSECKHSIFGNQSVEGAP